MLTLTLDLRLTSAFLSCLISSLLKNLLRFLIAFSLTLINLFLPFHHDRVPARSVQKLAVDFPNYLVINTEPFSVRGLVSHHRFGTRRVNIIFLQRQVDILFTYIVMHHTYLRNSADLKTALLNNRFWQPKRSKFGKVIYTQPEDCGEMWPYLPKAKIAVMRKAIWRVRDRLNLLPVLIRPEITELKRSRRPVLILAGQTLGFVLFSIGPFNNTVVKVFFIDLLDATFRLRFCAIRGTD